MGGGGGGREKKDGSERWEKKEKVKKSTLTRFEPQINHKAKIFFSIVLVRSDYMWFVIHLSGYS